ncbi:MAG: PEGA domain-containing protein [Betaproteobacteria bacterium]
MSNILDQGNRTFIGSVVFVDIVGYSKTSVSEQLVLKDRFQSLLADSLKDIALEQRIILDTGDGAAMSFLGDPEDALFVGLHMRDFLQRTYASLGLPENAAQEDIDIGPQGALSVRIGINLGPVKLLRDINGHPNIVGDGINVAQRIMSFARPGQIVVSRSYFDVVSVISDEYAKLFKYEGSRTDKHVREHEIYVVGESVAAFDQARAGMADRAAQTNPKATTLAAAATGAHTPVSMGEEKTGEGGIPFLKDREKLTIVGSVLGAMVLVLVVAALMKKSPEPTAGPAVASGTSLQSATANAMPPVVIAPAVEVGKSAEISSAAVGPLVTASPVSASTAPAAESAKAPSDAAKVAKATAVKETPAEASKIATPRPVEMGTVSLRIDPWGEVLVNGRAIGISPPLKKYKLLPGKYKIEVKNGTFAPYITNIEVKAKDDVAVKYRFQ